MSTKFSFRAFSFYFQDFFCQVRDLEFGAQTVFLFPPFTAEEIDSQTLFLEAIPINL